MLVWAHLKKLLPGPEFLWCELVCTLQQIYYTCDSDAEQSAAFIWNCYFVCITIISGLHKVKFQMKFTGQV